MNDIKTKRNSPTDYERYLKCVFVNGYKSIEIGKRN